MTRREVSILFEHRSDVLLRVTGLLGRRGIEIDSMTMGRSEEDELSLITLIARVNDHDWKQLIDRLHKFIGIIRINDFDDKSMF